MVSSWLSSKQAAGVLGYGNILLPTVWLEGLRVYGCIAHKSQSLQELPAVFEF